MKRIIVETYHCCAKRLTVQNAETFHHEGGAGRLVTIKDIAREAGVSLGTASNALSGKPTVTPVLRARVVDAASRLNYRRDSVAANLRRNESRSVGLCIPALHNPFFCDLMQRIVSLAEHEEYDVLILETHEDGHDEMKKLETLYSNRVRGVFMIPTGGWMGRHDPGVPMIVVDRIRPDEGLPSVSLDNIGASAAAVEYLHGLGHRAIWMVVNSAEIWNSRQRIDGFLAAAKRFGDVETRVLEVGMTPQLTAQHVGEALDGQRPTALLAASGIATLGTLRALQDRSIRIPDDISLLGFDDVPWMEVLRPSISVVAQPIEEIARQAWGLMLAAFEGKTQSPHVHLGAKIIERESTKRIDPK